MNQAIQMWATGAIVVFVLGWVIKKSKKDKWGCKIEKWAEGLGIAFSVLLLRWLPASKAEKAEEGILVTVADWVGRFWLGFERGVLKDNEKQKEKQRSSKK